MHSLKINRPWGFYCVLQSGHGYLVKSLCIEPLQELSLQYHEHRSEQWIVVAGQPHLDKGDGEHIPLEIGQHVKINKMEKHRLLNKSDEPATIIEVQFGKYLDEDDIVRIEDIYNRV